MLCRHERVRDTENPARVLVQLARKVRTDIRQDFLRRAVLEHPMRRERFRDANTGVRFSVTI